MVKFWVMVVRSGEKTIEDVPEKYRDAVREELEK